jgi:pimeloyl-ACP methyl ester carboxylesterase
MRWAASALLIPLFVVSLPCSAQAHHAGELTLEPYSFRTYDGSVHPAELGHLWVPANRQLPSAKLIQLTFVRLRTSNRNPRSPVVFLPGGPGIPATSMGAVPVYYALFDKIQDFADVILLDQRGIGMSSPNTQCPKDVVRSPDVFQNESNFRVALIARARACAVYWRAKGVDPLFFSTAAAADDLEDLRIALSVEKISLVAHSYGTALALDAIMRHGEHLERVVLAGDEGPDRAVQMPLVFDFALRRLSNMAAAASDLGGAFPDTYQEFQRVLAQLNRQPISVRIRDGQSKQEIEEKVGAFFLQFAVKEMLPNARRADRIPALVYSMAQRDSSLLALNVQDFYNALTSGFTLMEFATLCSDGWSAERMQIARVQTSRSAFGDASFVHLDHRICSAIGAERRNSAPLLPVWSTVPTLLVSGTLDSNAPDFGAEEDSWGFENSTFVQVENGFHETLPSPEVQTLVTAFLGGSDVRVRQLRFPPLAFLTIDAAKAPPQEPR